jgi:hypothetical protein
MLVDTPTKLEKVTTPVKNAMLGNIKTKKGLTILNANLVRRVSIPTNPVNLSV